MIPPGPPTAPQLVVQGDIRGWGLGGGGGGDQVCHDIILANRVATVIIDINLIFKC